MGLLKTGMKLGTAAFVVREAGKAISSHTGQHQQQQQPQPQQQQQAYYQPQYPPQAYVDSNGYVHQQWCNGRCEGRCNGSHAENREITIRPEETGGYASDRKRGAPPMYGN